MTSLQRLAEEAVHFHQRGDLVQAELRYQQIIAADPAGAGARHMLGVIRAQQGRVAEALELIGSSLQVNPNDAAAWLNYGNAAIVVGRVDEALTSYSNALVLAPANADARRHRARLLHDLGRLDEALADCAALLRADPADTMALNEQGAILWNRGRLEDALENFNRILAAKPDDIEALNNRGNIFRDLKRLDAALADYDRVLGLRPGLAQTLNNRGATLSEMGRLDEALHSIDAALALQPAMAAAHSNRGFTLRGLGRFDEALASYDRALAIEPANAAALGHRGRTLIEVNRIAEGLESFARSAQLVCAMPLAGTMPPHKLRHDAEQRDHLASLGETLKAELHWIGGARLAGPAVNPANATAALADAWRGANPQIAVIDDLLTPQALEELRRFCLGSNMWRNVFQEGYLGAFPEHGFAAPLLAQIAEELRDTFPDIFQAHPLRYLWAFKYDSSLSGIAIHADEAAVNVNFWITPDAANRDPQSGGMVVWDKAAPLDWDFAEFNADAGAAQAFLARSGAKSVTIPYRANRAVIFDSNLFHKTDEIGFADGYENRRINVTLLYGRRQGPNTA